MSVPSNAPRRGYWLVLALTLCASAGCDGPLAALRDMRGQVEPKPAQLTPPPLIVTPVRVRTIQAAHSRLTFEDNRSGTLRAWKLARVAAESSGRVLTRNVELGQRVRGRQQLFSIDGQQASTLDRQSAAALELKHLDLAQRNRDLARAETLARGDDIPKSQLERQRHARDAAAAATNLAEVERTRARQSIADTRIRAPFSGIVAELALEVGDFAQRGGPAATIIDISRLRFEVGLTGADLQSMPKNMHAELTLTGGVGATVQADLDTVAPLPDPRTGLYTAQFVIANREGNLRPGMTGRVSLGQRLVEGVLVPRNAVLRSGAGFGLYVIEHIDGQPRARFRTVELGRQGQAGVEIVSGVQAGELIAVDGQFALIDGAAVLIESTQTAASTPAVPSEESK